jgi:hypothetical protein
MASPGYAIVDQPKDPGTPTRVYRMFTTLVGADDYARKNGFAVAKCFASIGTTINTEHAMRYIAAADKERGGGP